VAVLSLQDGTDNSAVLRHLMDNGVVINSFRELVPRMNDIFIKLVTEK
jgi:ABC-2 type transport system ATP-binding protein